MPAASSHRRMTGYIAKGTPPYACTEGWRSIIREYYPYAVRMHAIAIAIAIQGAALPQCIARSTGCNRCLRGSICASAIISSRQCAANALAQFPICGSIGELLRNQALSCVPGQFLCSKLHLIQRSLWFFLLLLLPKVHSTEYVARAQNKPRQAFAELRWKFPRASSF